MPKTTKKGPRIIPDHQSQKKREKTEPLGLKPPETEPNRPVTKPEEQLLVANKVIEAMKINAIKQTNEINRLNEILEKWTYENDDIIARRAQVALLLKVNQELISKNEKLETAKASPNTLVMPPHDTEIEKLKKIISNLNLNYDELQDDYHRDIDAYNRDVDERDAEIEAQQATITILKHVEIEKLKNIISNQKSEYDELQDDYNRNIDDRNDEIEAQQETIARLKYQKVIAEMKKQVHHHLVNDELKLTTSKLGAAKASPNTQVMPPPHDIEIETLKKKIDKLKGKLAKQEKKPNACNNTKEQTTMTNQDLNEPTQSGNATTRKTPIWMPLDTEREYDPLQTKNNKATQMNRNRHR